MKDLSNNPLKNLPHNFLNALKKMTIGLVLMAFVVAPVVALTGPASPVAAQSTGSQSNCEPTFLGIPPWYRGLTDPSDDCAIKLPDTSANSNSDELSKFIWKIVLNVIDMLLVASVYLASGFIIYGGFLWITGGARPELVARGRKTILNAVIGLVIAIGAIALNNLIFTSLIK